MKRKQATIRSPLRAVTSEYGREVRTPDTILLPVMLDYMKSKPIIECLLSTSEAIFLANQLLTAALLVQKSDGVKK